MEIPAPDELLEQVRSLPGGGGLLERLAGQTGVYLVGGAARDLLRGQAPCELDLVVEGDALELAGELGGQLVRHERFGTSTVSFGGFSYDIARARRESYPRPGALPEVTPAPLEEDLLRRDFTVNAIAIALCPPEPGTVSAAPRALEDLDRELLRVLHDRSFLDDPTRLMRLARYRSRLHFEVEPGTARLAAEAAGSGALDTVSGSRVGAELRLLAREPEPLEALRALGELGLEEAIHPQFGLRDPELGRRALSLLPPDAPAEHLVLALPLMTLEPGELRRLLDRLAFEADDRQAILLTATRARSLAGQLAAARQPSEVAAAAEGAPPSLVALAGALGAEGAARAWLQRLRHVRLEIGGGDLLAAGVPEGPAVGRALRTALEAKLDGRIHSREGELEVALQAAQATG